MNPTITNRPTPFRVYQPSISQIFESLLPLYGTEQEQAAVDEYGEAEGVSYFEKCRITNLCIDTEDEQRLLRLVDEELRSKK